MPVTVKHITLWRTEVANQPGLLAQTLAPMAAAGADLQIVMGYRYPGAGDKAAIEVYPVSGKKLSAAASGAGLKDSAIPTLLVEGDNKPALGQAIAQAMAAAGINLSFIVAQVIGRKYAAVIGFENAADAKKGAQIVKKAAVKKRK